MKLLTKLALASSLALGTMSVINTTYINKQTVQAAKKDQGVTIKSLMLHPRSKNHNKYKYVDTIDWNPYAKIYRNGKVISKQVPSAKYNSTGTGDIIQSIKKFKGKYYLESTGNYSLMSDVNAPTIYTAKAKVPVLAYAITKIDKNTTNINGINQIGYIDGKYYKKPIPAGYISKGDTMALLSKKKYVFNNTKYYMIYTSGYVKTNKMQELTNLGSSAVEYIKVSDFNKFKKGGKIQIAPDGSYLTNYAYHFYPEDRYNGDSKDFFCPNRKVFYDLKH